MVDSRLLWILRITISTSIVATIVTVEIPSLFIVTKVYENIL